MTRLQQLTQKLASDFGEDQELFGMTLASIHWTDGEAAGYNYWPTDKKIEDFTVQECGDTLHHMIDWWVDVLAQESDS